MIQFLDVLCDLFQVLSSGAIGLLVGALLAEGAIFIPYWRSLHADVFYSLHKEYGPRLYRFFAPLTIAPAILIIAASGLCAWTNDSGRWATYAANILLLCVLGTYAAYFKQANARLATGTLSANELSLELARWQRWHWVRVAIGLLAFAASLIALNMRA